MYCILVLIYTHIFLQYCTKARAQSQALASLSLCSQAPVFSGMSSQDTFSRCHVHLAYYSNCIHLLLGQHFDDCVWIIFQLLLVVPANLFYIDIFSHLDLPDLSQLLPQGCGGSLGHFLLYHITRFSWNQYQLNHILTCSH